MSTKLAALAEAQDRVRAAEERLGTIRGLENALAFGKLIRVHEASGQGDRAIAPLTRCLTAAERDVLIEGFLITKHNAEYDRNVRLAEVEEMLK